MAAPLTYTFHHIHVHCSDVEATIRWFTEGVGGELVERRESRGVQQGVINLGGATIFLRPARSNESFTPGMSNQYGTDHFGLRVDDVDATVEELRRRGVTIDVEPWDFSDVSRIAFIKGPDEVRIELVQPRR